MSLLWLSVESEMLESILLDNCKSLEYVLFSDFSFFTVLLPTLGWTVLEFGGGELDPVFNFAILSFTETT